MSSRIWPFKRERTYSIPTDKTDEESKNEQDNYRENMRTGRDDYKLRDRIKKPAQNSIEKRKKEKYKT